MPPRRSAAGEETEAPPRVAQPPNSSDDPSKTLKNRPNPSKLRQQKLSAWQPILTAYTAIPAIFVTGLVFIPVGVVLLLAAESVKEWTFEYGSVCSRNVQPCQITMNFSEPFSGNVYFYYQLENFFQNHRRYVKSRSDKQLLGDVTNVGSDCGPYDYATVGSNKYPIAPCGAIANSMFNDTFRVFKVTDSLTRTLLPLTYDGVIWDVDRDTKFVNPRPKAGGNLCDAFEGTVKPPNWQKHPCELDKEHPENNGFQNVDFIVWMRTAALPSFRKLYRILDRNTPDYRDGLPAGTYQLEIQNNYPVEIFNGKKYFVISTTSWFGGRNKFLGVAYIIIGSVCVVLGAIFSFIHVKFGHSFAEMADITNNAPS